MMAASAPAIGAVALIEPGVEVWSTERRRLTPGGDTPLGGIVYRVTEIRSPDTGFLARGFACIDHHDTRPEVHWSTLGEHEVDPTMAHTVDVQRIVVLWRRLAEELAYSGRYRLRRGPAIAYEARLADAIRCLQELVFGHNRPEHALIATPPPAPPKHYEPRPTFPVDPGMFCD